MTITGSGEISMSDLNVEFGRSATANISLATAFLDTYAQYGAINRNTSAGRAITLQATLGNNAISYFYSYNDLATVHWSYNFTSDSSTSVDVYIDYNAVNIYNNRIVASGGDNGSNIDTSTSSGASLGNISLTLDQGGIPNFVDINCYDPDTNITIYSINGDSPVSYTATSIGQIYGYQRFVLDLYFYD